MDFNKLLLGTVVKDLKCSSCKNYLSRFPIYLTAKGENICGRCSVPEEVIAVRNKVYELIAVTVMFPCRYVGEGCMEKQSGNSISDHEEICSYRLSKCPASQFDKCQEEISLPNLQEHCENLHSKLLLKGDEFTLDLTKSQEINNICILKDNFYIMKVKFNHESTLLSTSMYCFESMNFNLDSYQYNLSFNSGMKNITIGGPIPLITDDEEEDNKSLYINSLNLQTSKLTGKITIFKKHMAPTVPNKVSEELLRMLKCSRCSKYILPPIKYYFSDKKTICYSCGSSHYCSLIEGRSLDIVAQNLDFPCEHQKNGCTLIAAPHILQNHQLYCLHGPTNCPFSEYNQCDWTGLQKNVVSHITESHAKMIATSSRFSEQVSVSCYNSYAKCYIIKFSKYYFRLSFSSERDYCRWTVQMIGEFIDRFNYELEIFKYGECKKLVAVQCCQPLTKKSDLFKNSSDYCFYSYDQIKSFLHRNNQIIFKIRIFQG